MGQDPTEPTQSMWPNTKTRWDRDLADIPQWRTSLNHIFVSQTIYFTLLYSLKTRLFINPVLKNPNHTPYTMGDDDKSSSKSGHTDGVSHHRAPSALVFPVGARVFRWTALGRQSPLSP